MKTQYAYQTLIDAKKILNNPNFQLILKDILGKENFPIKKLILKENNLILVDNGVDKIYLDLNDTNPIFIKYKGDFLMEKIQINFHDITKKQFQTMVEHAVLEIRPFGVILTKINKNYKNDFEQSELIYLEEKNYYYKKETLQFQIPNLMIPDSKIKISLLNKFTENLSSISADMETKLTIDNKEQLMVRLNDEDFSKLYNQLYGKNIVSRIYELIHGKITEMNSRDIYWIHLKKLSEDAFGLKELKGITRKEIALVGLSYLEMSNHEQQYLQKFITENLNSTYHDQISRMELLKTIIPNVEGTILKENPDSNVLISTTNEPKSNTKNTKSNIRLLAKKRKSSSKN